MSNKDIAKEQIDQLKQMTLPELAKEIANARLELDYAKDIQAQKQLYYDMLTVLVVPDLMDEQGVETLKVKGVGRLQCSADIRCSCPKPNQPDLLEWMRENNHGELVKDTINSSTLKAFVKEQMKLGEKGKYPKHLLKVEPYSRATVVQA